MNESRRIVRVRQVIYDVTYGRVDIIYGPGTSPMTV
jgi:hypothetical protein